MNKAIASLLLSVLLSACQLAPRHQRPEAPIAAEFSPEYADAEEGATAATLAWQDFFPDPRLRSLVAIALERNRDLAISVSQIQEARALFRVQRADRLPTITLGAGATRSGGAGSALAEGIGNLPGGRAPDEIYTASVASSAFELDFWGRVRNLTAAARAQYLATVSATRAFRMSLIRDVAFAHLSLLEANERIELAQATLNSRTEELRLAQRRFDSGVTSETDLRQAETLLSQAETQLAELRQSREQATNLLTVLIGGPLDSELPQAIPLQRELDTPVLAAGAPSALLLNRPDIMASEERLRAARANIGAARAAFFPTVLLTGQYGYASTELDSLFGGDHRTWSYGPRIDVPLFDFGRRRANLAVAHARETAAVADYQRTIQTAFQEVSDTLAARRFLADQVSAQERGVFSQRRLAELARTRYRGGVTSYLEVLDAERNLFASEQTLLQLRRAQAENLVSLYIALGGGGLERE